MEKREIKCRIRLQEKETGEKLTLFNSIFDAMNGVAWFEIDRKKWAFLGADEFTGLLDKNGKEIYEGDVVGGFPHGTVEVRWCIEYACFEAVWEEEEYDEEDIQTTKERTSLFANELKDCSDAWEVIGNIYETPPYIGTK